MKKKFYAAAILAGFGVMLAVSGAYHIQAAETQGTTAEKTIYDGIHIGSVDIGGKTEEEAKAAVNAYVEEVKKRTITLHADGIEEDKKLTVTAEELGLYWENQDVIEEALNLGKTDGNIIERYKAMKDIEHSEVTYEIEFAVDSEKTKAYLEEHRGELEKEAKNATLTKTGSGFSITDGEEGLAISIEKSIAAINTFFNGDWNGENASIQLSTEVSQPQVTKEMCEKIQSQPMGSYTTSYTSSSTSRSNNIDNAVKLINGTVLMPGENFSCLEHMVPFTAENGYYPAGSYLGGKLVDSLGGGVCQVSTTLYNAVLLAELEVVQRNNHGLTVSYVPLSTDAAIAESSNMDLIFTNNTNAPIYIEGYTNNKTVTFSIYGYDERPSNRTIKYESVTLEVLHPGEDVVTVDASLPPGSRRVTQSSHTGYRAALYKYVYVDGKQTDKIKVNTSYYAAAPNYVTAGPEVVVETEVPTDPVTGEPIPTESIPADGTETQTADVSSTDVIPSQPEESSQVAETSPAETPAETETTEAETIPTEITPTEPAPAETVQPETVPVETPAAEPAADIPSEGLEETVAVG